MTLPTLDRLRPIKDHILIRPDEPQETTKGGIIIPATARDVSKGEKKKAHWGTVIAVGPGNTDNQGRFWPVEVIPGDRVLVNDAAPREWFKDPDGKDVFLSWHYACIAVDDDSPARRAVRNGDGSR
jgi:chaperonin GroES